LGILKNLQDGKICDYIVKTASSADSNAQIGKNQGSPKVVFEARLQKMRLKESVRQKQELEKKLKYIEDNIGYLSAVEIERSSKQVKEYSWLTNEERKKWKEDSMKKAQDAEEFVKKVKAIQKEIKKRKKEKQKQIEEQQKKETEEKEKREKEEAEQKAKQKEEEAKKKAEEIEAKRKERQLLAKLASEVPSKKTYLYQKMNQEFVKEIEMPELEKRKKEIAEKRNVYKPIRLVEIEEFKKKHDELMKKSEEEREKERLKRIHDELKYHQKVLKELKTAFTDEVIKKDSLIREKIKEEEDAIQERFTKMKDYAKIVKENYKPTVSTTKAEELKKHIESLKTKPREAKKLTKEDLKIRTPAERNASLDSKVQPSKSAKSPRPIIKKKKCSDSTRSIDLSKAENKKEIPENKIKKINYLEEFAKKRKESNRRSMPEVIYQKVVTDANLSSQEKYQLIKAQTEVLEQNARQKEELMSIKKDMQTNVSVGAEVSDMYINAIKAKLSLLES